MPCFCLVFTLQAQDIQCCVDLEGLAQFTCSFITDLIFCDKLLLVMLRHFLISAWCSLFKFRTASVVLTSSASLSAHAPFAFIPVSAFAFDHGTMTLSSRVFPCFFIPLKLSIVSVVFTFNASLSVHTPSTPILLPVIFVLQL